MVNKESSDEDKKKVGIPPQQRKMIEAKDKAANFGKPQPMVPKQAVEDSSRFVGHDEYKVPKEEVDTED